MRIGSVLRTVLVGIGLVAWVASSSAQQIRFFPDFNSVAGLNLIDAAQATWNSQQVLRVTKGSAHVGAAWFTTQQPVNSGFTSYFRFQIHSATCCNPGDGLAFVVQNAASTDKTYGATGAGVTARGVGNGGLGYTGIPNSLAVEIDTVRDQWDPNANHVAVQSCGTATNGPVHISGSFPIGNAIATSCLVGALSGTGAGIYSPTANLGVTCSNPSCTDGAPHDVVIEYTAPAQPSGVGTLMVYIDPTFIAGTHTPVRGSTPAISIPYNIDSRYYSKGISLAGNSSAWVGFTASQTGQQNQDILAWEFTPHAPAQVQQPIPPGGTTASYTFGGHISEVTYPTGQANNGCPGYSTEGPCLMTLTATPWSRISFYKNRLLQQPGKPFANEQCVVYLGTGGNCIVYSITCQTTLHPNVNVSCPASQFQCNSPTDPGCIVFSTSFYTADGITPQNADYLKADPALANPPANNWSSIFLSYDPNAFDGKTSGAGPSGSDFAATFKVGAKP